MVVYVYKSYRWYTEAERLERGRWLQRHYVNTHPEYPDCITHTCIFHNPSDHHMLKWPTRIQMTAGLIDRICEHRIGHPDPDSMGYFLRRDGIDLGMHPCCPEQCCDPEQWL